jgi:hypothetical protein
MKRDEVMLHLNKLFNQLVEKYGASEAIGMFDETVELAKVILVKTEEE